jgi:hypothetical protein
MASINIRQKGANAERDIADDLNFIINDVRSAMGLPALAKPMVQRNQNQSAVGGKDLTGTFGLAIEVKRQEQLSINTWWAQCLASAKELNEIPVLLFKQSRQKWRCIMPVALALPVSPAVTYSSLTSRAEIDYETFKLYFRERVGRTLYNNAAQEV